MSWGGLKERGKDLSVVIALATRRWQLRAEEKMTDEHQTALGRPQLSSSTIFVSRRSSAIGIPLEGKIQTCPALDLSFEPGGK